MTVPIGDPRPSGQAGPAGDQRASGEASPAGDPRAGGQAILNGPNDGKTDAKSKPAKKTTSKRNR